MRSFINNNMLPLNPECHVWVKSYSLLEILKKCGGYCKIGRGELASKLYGLMPRLYYIASSPFVNQNEMHIVVDVVSYVNAIENKRNGIVSNYWTDGANVGQGIMVLL
jgi:sulfite reductase alpha subunit-like flavoprotein